MILLFSSNSLIGGDSHHLVNIVYRAATAEVVYRCSHPLEDRPYSHSTTEALYQLVGDVTHLKPQRFALVRWHWGWG